MQIDIENMDIQTIKLDLKITNSKLLIIVF